MTQKTNLAQLFGSGLPCASLGSPGLSWLPFGSTWGIDLGFPWALLVSPGLPWHLLGCSGESIWDSPVLPWASLGSPGFPWVSLGGRSETSLRLPGLPRTLQDAPGSIWGSWPRSGAPGPDLIVLGSIWNS